MSKPSLLGSPYRVAARDALADQVPHLHGRSDVLELLELAFERATDRRGTALVLRGEAGVGKSALLRALRAAAGRSASVMYARGVKSESVIPFAGLQHLLLPLLEDVDGLAASRREPLLAVLGYGSNARYRSSPDAYAVALAALELLRATPADARLLAVDDVHWMDPQTLAVLAFMARRIGNDPLLMVFAARPSGADSLAAAEVRELSVEALDDVAACELLDEVAPELPHYVRGRLLSVAAGNPLAIIELARAVTPTDDAGLSLGFAFPTSDRLVSAFAATLAELPSETQAFLLVAASDPGCALPDLLDATRAVTGQAVGAEAMQRAIEGRLIEVEPTGIRFRHPLTASAIYQRATIGERTGAHAALADVLRHDSLRRTWHRAGATIEPDEEIVDELVDAAADGRQRGEVSEALIALIRASALTRDRERSSAALLRAAEIAYELGDRRSALYLIERADGGHLGPVESARLMAVRDSVSPGARSETGYIDALCRAADDAKAHGDSEVSLRLLWRGAIRCWMDGSLGEPARSLSRLAESLAVPAADPRLIAIAALTGSKRSGELRERLSFLDVDRSDADELGCAGWAAFALGDLPCASSYLRRVEASYRASSQVGLLARILVGRMSWRFHTDDWSQVLADAEEAATLVKQTGDTVWAGAIETIWAMHAAWRGDDRAAEETAIEIQKCYQGSGSRWILAAAQHARGVGAAGAGRHDEAFDHLRRLFDPADPAHHAVLCQWTVSDLAEAAQRAGRVAEARELIDKAGPGVAVSPSPIIQITRRYAAAVLADEDSAEACFTSALSADLSQWPLERARIHLAYGVWLRRHKRVVESRAPLRVARDTFGCLGAEPWARRAQEELRATGEQTCGAKTRWRDDLTPQELQIARLAASGLTNREIGQQLFLSPRTIGSHLYRLFRKLGISSRSQLQSAAELAVEAAVPGVSHRPELFVEAHGRVASAQ